MSESERASFLRDNPPFDCKLCGEHVEFTEREYERRGVCSACANYIANHYNHAHGGRWLTWPNERHERSGKAKKKIKPGVRFRVYERDGFRCVYCGARKNLTIDHVKAESDGGAHEAGNFVTCCKTCNSKKGTKSLADFWEART